MFGETNKMNYLRLKIPPVAQVLFLSIAIYLTAKYTPGYVIHEKLRLSLSSLLFLIGSFFAIAGVLSFRSANTTVDPRDPSKSNQLVKSGIYAYSRNPMYVGMLTWLVAICFFFGSYYSFIYCIFFVFYMTKFQILPEEEMLNDLFPGDYVEYSKTVRRWL